MPVLLPLLFLALAAKPASASRTPPKAKPAPASPRMPRNVPPAAPLAPLTASIRLTVKTATGQVELTAGAKPQPQPRPVLTMKSGEQPQVRWQIRNTDLKKALPSVVVHFLVNREDAAGAPIPAGPQKGSYQDSVLGTDLPPKGGTTGEYATPVYEPGVYLVEIEILDEEGNRRMFCAVDLKVEP